MAARLLVIGLDAAEPTFIEAWAGQGILPNVQALQRRARRVVLDNSLRTLPGAIWPELETGISCGRIPHYYHPGQLHTSEAERRAIAPEEVDPEGYYWMRAARAGLKVASLDMPQTVVVADMGGIQLTEW